MKRFLLHCFGLALLCIYFFTRNNAALFLPYDGGYMRELMRFAFEWCHPGTVLALNPLQGLGSCSFPTNYWLSPSALLSYFLHGNSPDSTLVYTLITIELFGSVWYLARSLDANPATRIASSWSAAVLVMPFIVPPAVSYLSFYAISGIIPYIIEHMAISTLMVGAIIGIRLNEPRKALFYACFLTALIVYSILVYPIIVILSVPLVSLFVAFWLITQPTSFLLSYRTFFALAIFSLVLLVPFLFVFGLLLDTVPSFFSRELITGRPTWVFISILFHGPLHLGWGNDIVYLSGLSGGVIAIAKSTGRFRKGAMFYVPYCVSLLLTGLLSTFVFTSFRGPSMLYFEWFLWPFMFIYGSFLFEWLIRLLRDSNLALIRDASSMVLRFGAALPSELVIPLVAFLSISLCDKPKEVSALNMPPKITSFISILRNEAALTPGAPWRGSVATFNGNKPAGEGTKWEDNVSYDAALWQVTGNDHRAIGLWWHNIPTLFSYNQFMTPDYYYVTTRFFSAPNDLQQRSVVVLTHPDARLLELFGVRFMISERKLDLVNDMTLRDEFEWLWPGSTPSSSGDPSYRRAQFLYELRHPNLGDYSPNQQIFVKTANDAIQKMRDRNFDPAKQVIVSATIPQDLTAAERVSLVWDRNEIRVKATSPGCSLLVLPLAFSNCLDISSKHRRVEKCSPKLIRTDIALTGVLFSGDLDATISLRLGAFSSVFGKIFDYLDLKRFKM